MITIEKAKQLVFKNVKKLTPIHQDLTKSLNYYLAEDIYSPVPIPLFNQSAMDGYAFCHENRNLPLKIVDTIPAGISKEIELQPNEAVRIFTGAKVPKDADTVVMQELTKVVDDQLFIKDTPLQLGGNIRKKGNQLQKGDLVLKKGSIINPGTIGFLSGMGIQKIMVYPLPKVSVIATGDELVKPGNQLKDGQIYESNTYMLKAALDKLNIQSKITTVDDNKENTIRAIKEAIETSDLLIISGGISVGEYDFVKSALEHNKVNEVFYKVNQKPGKPLYFGKTNRISVFALPGNPAAALNCFYQYVHLAIKIMTGSNVPELTKLKLPITQSYTKKIGRANFLKAATDLKTVNPLEGQASDALQSFSLANCLILLSEETVTVHENEMVDVYLLP